ncbi:unnamed protein product [Notodromas monacha]|uniref:Uncharacterized protein n=1 Tax=Notodromas monacha TaxID=399045 RepID=A0A7R9GJ72_9CRUS|nr:unnamed protein product [Notodromas monacha]CAG0923226.1 unnamed protein product [Notodromas monacha]
MNKQFQPAPLEVINISQTASKTGGRMAKDFKFARILDATRHVLDFSRKVPHPAHTWPFKLDPFQEQAVLCLEAHSSVLVAAHTSAGKTVVAEYAIALSLRHLARVIYTSPVKALSNQKFRDFKETFGDVGLLTGDVQLNQTASCLVMTTEILRSMLYNGSDVVRELEWVVFDEVHYINDQERGVVWEEILILLPDHVGLVLLSATVPNAVELADWIGTIKKRKINVVYTDKRPVPLEHYLWTNTSTQVQPSGKKTANCDQFLIVDAKSTFLNFNYVNAQKAKKNDKEKENSDKSRNQQPGQQRNNQNRPGGNNNPSHQHYQRRNQRHQGGHQASLPMKEERLLYTNLVRNLEARDKLPVIVFTLSRQRCDQNAANLPESLDLLTAAESRESVRSCLTRLTGSDRNLPQIKSMEELLKRGIGVHHSGILPIVKEIVELLFGRGLVKLLFATETFAMGVNMPARTVVFDSIRKHDGTQFRDLLPSEYTQMAGRAGRRGLDATGHVIVLCKTDVWESGVLQNMMLGRATQLESKFRVTYAMILNLKRVQSVRVVDMMKRSFGSAGIVGREVEHREKLAKLTKSWEDYPELQCQDCSGKLPRLFSTLDDYWKTWTEDLALTVLRCAFGSKFIHVGRIVALRPPKTDPCWRTCVGGAIPAVILAVPSTGNKVDLTVFYCTAAGTSEAGTTTSAAVELLEAKRFLSPSVDLWFPVSPFQPDWTNFVVREVAPYEVVGVSKVFMRVDRPDLVIGEWKKNKLKVSPMADDLVRFLRSLNAGNHWCDPVRDYYSSLLLDDSYVRLQHLKSELGQNTSANCPVFFDHFMHFFKGKQIEKEKECLELLLSEESLSVYPEYQAKLEVLCRLGYLNQQEEVKLKGRVACAIFQHELMLTEILFENLLGDFQPAEIAALLSCLVFQGKEDKNLKGLTPKLQEGEFSCDLIKDLAKRIGQVQLESGLTHEGPSVYPEQFKFGLVPVVYQWARGVPFADIATMTSMQEGIVVRNIQRLDEVLRDCQGAAKTLGDPKLMEKMVEASLLVRRDIVFAASLYTQDKLSASNFCHSRRSKAMTLLCSKCSTSAFATSARFFSASRCAAKYAYEEHLNDAKVRELYEGVMRGSRGHLAQAITLVESVHPVKKIQAQSLLTLVLRSFRDKEEVQGVPQTFRIGLSGPPGAGKSTFIESFGKMLTNSGEHVAVLAVDPSSTRTGGSLLGDKTRMPELTRDLRAYIRPSPTGGKLGGVARNTQDSLYLCEAAGYKTVLVETVGVGQSELAVADMVDCFVLLAPPGAGDELQGMKKGIMERCHLVVVTKADGDLLPASRRMQYDIMSALKYMRPLSPNWRTRVLRISAHTGEGLDDLKLALDEYRKIMNEHGELASVRESQHTTWMWSYIEDNILERFRSHEKVGLALPEISRRVRHGLITPGAAAEVLLEEFSAQS